MRNSTDVSAGGTIAFAGVCDVPASIVWLEWYLFLLVKCKKWFENMLTEFCSYIGPPVLITLIGAFGLLLTFIGSITMIAPNVPGLKRLLRTTELVKQVEQGRKQLFETEKLLPRNPGYDVIADILKENVGESRHPAQIEAFKAGSPYAQAFGGSEVWIAVEGEGNLHVGSGGDIPEGEYEMINVCPSALAHQLIDREIDRLQTDRFLQWGAAVMTVGFLLQLVAYFALNVCPV